ncbi:MAG: hypothetical protein ACKO96_49090, partial [Flammeovirgaceae bacterium]
MNIIQLFLNCIMNGYQQFNEQMQQQLGDNYGLFVESLQQTSPTSIRANPQKWLAQNCTPVGWSEFGYYLPNRCTILRKPLLWIGSD